MFPSQTLLPPWTQQTDSVPVRKARTQRLVGIGGVVAFDGQHDGYTSYLLDLALRRAVIVLSDVANPATTDLDITVLGRHT